MTADAVIADMQQLETALLHTDFRNSPDQLERLLAADFEEVSPLGQRSTREQVMQWLLKKDPAHRWQLSQWQVQELSIAARIVRYHAIQSVPPSASKGALHCSLWNYDNTLHCWRLQFHQSTKVQA